jgi:hypothetical protein
LGSLARLRVLQLRVLARLPLHIAGDNREVARPPSATGGRGNLGAGHLRVLAGREEYIRRKRAARRRQGGGG